MDTTAVTFGHALGDELHSVWCYCFTVLLHYYYYSYDNGCYFKTQFTILQFIYGILSDRLVS